MTTYDSDPAFFTHPIEWLDLSSTHRKPTLNGYDNYTVLGAFQASLNILIHYENFYNAFYVPYFHIQLLSCNTKKADKLKLNAFTHT
jgi:hypothetical protein